MKLSFACLCLAVLVFADAAYAEMTIKAKGQKVRLGDNIIAGARERYDAGSFPREKSVVPEPLQRLILDIVGLNNSLNELECKKLTISRVLQIQKSTDLSFSGDRIVKGYFNENWIFDSCGTELIFQIAGTSKGAKLEKIVIVQLGLVDKVSKQKLVQVFSF